MKSIVLILSAFAAFAQMPAAFEVATVKPSAEITSAMVQAGKIHAGVSIDAQRVDGLIGKYHVAIEFSPQEALNVARYNGINVPAGAGGEAGDRPLEAAGPCGSIFAAVERHGLKLESRKAPIEVIVADHAEKMPAEN